MGRKTKKGVTKKMKKWVRGSVACWKKIVIFWPTMRTTQKPFGNRFRVSRSTIDFKKWRLNFKWPNHSTKRGSNKFFSVCNKRFYCGKNIILCSLFINIFHFDSGNLPTMYRFLQSTRFFAVRKETLMKFCKLLIKKIVSE